jgi:hypothetical protein
VTAPPFWQCSAYLAGRNHRATTKERDPQRAKEKAEDWYLSLRVKHRSGELRGGRNFKDAAEKFLPEYEALTAGERNPEYVRQFEEKLRVHILPLWDAFPSRTSRRRRFRIIAYTV